MKEGSVCSGARARASPMAGWLFLMGDPGRHTGSPDRRARSLRAPPNNRKSGRQPNRIFLIRAGGKSLLLNNIQNNLDFS